MTDAYLIYLAECMSLCDKLTELLKEDSEQIHAAVRGEPEKTYLRACDTVTEKLAGMKKKMKILYSEACAELI